MARVLEREGEEKRDREGGWGREDKQGLRGGRKRRNA